MPKYDPLRRLLERLRGHHAPAPRAGGDSTGQTVFDDLPLRFRALTADSDLDYARLSDPAGPPGAFKIRLASQGTRRDAGKLVERRYAERGYQTGDPPPDPHLFTFLAYDEGQLAGTVAVRLDSAKGLSADQLYHEELAALRADGAQLCEFTRLAVDVKAASKPVLAGLFHTAYLFAARVRRYTHAVIEVNPRHVVFYKRALGFSPLGAERMNPRVQAPGVLLGVSFDDIAVGLAKYAGRGQGATGERSIFPYAFGPDEEPGILKRLKALDRG